MSRPGELLHLSLTLWSVRFVGRTRDGRVPRQNFRSWPTARIRHLARERPHEAYQGAWRAADVPNARSQSVLIFPVRHQPRSQGIEQYSPAWYDRARAGRWPQSVALGNPEHAVAGGAEFHPNRSSAATNPCSQPNPAEPDMGDRKTVFSQRRALGGSRGGGSASLIPVRGAWYQRPPESQPN